MKMCGIGYWTVNIYIVRLFNTFSELSRILKFILENDASFNLYMFHGGSNFGFMNGANEGIVEGTITSYGKCLCAWNSNIG